MLIDWFTVGAQALNFLILVWLMKRFLYKPILNAIATREKLIAAELADAAAKKAEAQKDRDAFQHKNEEFDRQRDALMSKATDEAKAERQRLLDEARNAADALSAKRQETLRSDARNLSQAIARRTQDEVFAISRKALADLATTSLEERMGEVFTRRLREMDGKAKETLGAALKTTPGPAVVSSAFDLPPEERAKIQNAINETFSADVHLRFETAPDLVGGIELSANGQKVAWSIADYLASLKKGVGELLKERDAPDPKAEHKPGAKTAPQPEPAAHPASEIKAEPKVEATAQTKPTPEIRAEPRPETETAPKPKADAKAKPNTDVEPKAESKPEGNAEPKPPAKVEPPSDTIATSKPEAKAVPTSEAGSKPKTESEAKVVPKPEAEAASKPKAEAKAEPKASAPKAAPAGP
jgi:F-type H+-transporting ATPase subunit b